MGYILVVDDDPEVLGTISRALTREGYTVALAESAQKARSWILRDTPDMIILDIMMPVEDGITYCKTLRSTVATQSLPILFLSALARTEDVVNGLDAGGDDYLAKPFQIRELNARVRALLRRIKPNGSGMLTVGDLSLNRHTFELVVGSDTIQLTSTEYRLLSYLMASPGQAHSVHDLLDAVWEYPAGTGDPDLVRAHIRNLRAKIEPDTSKPCYIQTIHGVGYMVRG